MRAFVRLRQILATHKELARKLEGNEEKIGEHDERFLMVFEAIRRLIEPPSQPEQSRHIGFARD
jgi:hypothetical protein